jgi:hypothetical protein
MSLLLSLMSSSSLLLLLSSLLLSLPFVVLVLAIIVIAIIVIVAIIVAAIIVVAVVMLIAVSVSLLGLGFSAFGSFLKVLLVDLAQRLVAVALLNQVLDHLLARAVGQSLCASWSGSSAADGTAE